MILTATPTRTETGVTVKVSGKTATPGSAGTIGLESFVVEWKEIQQTPKDDAMYHGARIIDGRSTAAKDAQRDQWRFDHVDLV